MKPDVSDAQDLYKIVASFYTKLLGDDSINHLFAETVQNGLQEHLQQLVRFWDQMIFGNYRYDKNVMEIHQQQHQLTPFTAEHFEIWLGHFHGSIDELYEGEIAQNIKDRAYSIAYIMRTKMLQ